MAKRPAVRNPHPHPRAGSRPLTNGRRAHDRDAHAALDPRCSAASSSKRCGRRSTAGAFRSSGCRASGSTVTADIFADGHDVLAAVLLYRKAGDARVARSADGAGRRTTAGRRPSTSSRSAATSTRSRAGSIASRRWRRDLSRRSTPDRTSRASCSKAASSFARPRRGRRHTRRSSPGPRRELADTAMPPPERVAAARSEELWRCDGGAHRIGKPPPASTACSACSSSASARGSARGTRCSRAPPDTIRTRSATFDEAAARLPYIAVDGLRRAVSAADPSDRPQLPQGTEQHARRRTRRSGSPWAIGSDEGGHTAIEPGLGTLDDFDRFVEAAARHGLEIALDLAFQASPDHPYVREHPEWFRHRPDGTIKYAENPPKKYQDIYPFDFESADWQALWQRAEARLRVLDRARRAHLPRRQPAHQAVPVLGMGARASCTREHPDAIFLAEAFTRPKVMRYLAKGGFSQSYTLLHLAQHEGGARRVLHRADADRRPRVPAAEPLRQHARHPARISAARRPAGVRRSGSCSRRRSARPTASTAASSSSRTCRSARQRGVSRLGEVPDPAANCDRPDSLAELIARVNAIRREHPALQHDRGLRVPPDRQPRAALLQQDARPTARDLMLVVVNLDPLRHAARLRAAAARRLGLHAAATRSRSQDLLSGERYFWRGAWNYVRLDPGSRVAHILHVRLPRPCLTAVCRTS